MTQDDYRIASRDRPVLDPVQLGLPGLAAGLPEGLAYAPELIAADEEQALAARIAALPLRAFQFRGFEGNRRTVSFGWHYAFDGSGLRRAEPIPDWLLAVRARAAAFAGLPAETLEHVLLIEYPVGAGIGWHRDRPVFGDVIGLSLLAPARLRFRHPVNAGWQRASLVAEPRSAYLLRGPARSQWEHSIPAMAETRYSITLRSFAGKAPDLP